MLQWKENTMKLIEDQVVDITLFKKSIYDSNFTFEQASMIWDFYVARSLAGTGTLTIPIEEYGWSTKINKINGCNILEKKLTDNAEIENIIIIKGNTVQPSTLKNIKLFGENININNSCIVLQQNVTISINEEEKIDITTKETRINCLFRHIRNSFAHGNTYFFNNGYLMLEDKEGKNIKARILIKQKCLLEWIKIIDKCQKRYIIKEI